MRYLNSEDTWRIISKQEICLEVQAGGVQPKKTAGKGDRIRGGGAALAIRSPNEGPRKPCCG